MKYIWVVLVTMLMSFGALANQHVVDMSKLTPEQRAAVQQMVQQNSNPVNQAVTLMTRVEDFGATAARGVVAFAKELGVAANEFYQTPMGKLVLVGIVFFFAADKVVGFIFLFFVFPIFVVLVIRSYRPLIRVDKAELRPVLWGMWHRRFITERSMHNRFAFEANIMYTSLMLIGAAVSLAIGLANLL